MRASPTVEEIKHDLHILLAARRDLGPVYDDHLIDSFVEKLQAQPPARPPVDARRPVVLRPPLWHRLSPLLVLGLVAVTLLLTRGTWSLRHIAAMFFLLLCLVVGSLLLAQLALIIHHHRPSTSR